MSRVHPDCEHDCQLREYHGLRACWETGECDALRNEPGHAQVDESSSSPAFDESNPERVGRGAALLLMLAITLASILVGD